MNISDIQAGQGDIDVVADVVSVTEPRTFQKWGKESRVANAMIKDSTGEIKLSLWNEQIDLVKTGIKIHLTKGYCSEYQGQKQLTTGKFGKLEIVQ